ncbi:MAG TPA: energy transducer TonB [Candidatus Eisenbacteria bacterium]|nr:energy transducer TonB [Candidatus Eisenbacteria bacterium]
MNAFDRRHPSQRRYYRNVRNAMIGAAAAHAAVLALAPVPLPPIPAMRPSVLHMVETPGLLLAGGTPAALRSAATDPGASGAPPRLPAMVEPIREVPEPVRTMPATAAAPPQASDGRTGAGHGTGMAGGLGGAEEAPSVFYAYDTAPRATRRVEPPYPPAARAAGLEGTVVVNLNIDERGRILRAWVAEARASDVLVEAALDAAYEFAFEPGTWRGAPVKCTVAIPFQFRLKQTMEVEGP